MTEDDKFRIELHRSDVYYGDPLAADRIEELVEENKELTLQLLAAHGQAADALDRAVVAEAKLAKAMAGLRRIADHKHFSWDQGWIQNAGARIASATLRKLEEKKT
jgi:hypothetical protein